MKKTALITGASRGLGREISLSLAARGYAVAVNYLKSDREAGELLTAFGEGAISLKGDVGDYSAVEKMAATIKKEWGRLDVLVNNAGMASDALLVKLKEEDWDAVIRTNLKGCFNTIKAFAPLMNDSGGGHIVNVSSISGLRGREGQAAYAASKAAVIGLTLSAAREFSEYNIRVNALLPGYMPTGMGGASPEALQRARAESVLGRLSEPKEAAAFISWLVETRGVTGQVFTLDSRI